jgi:hypothetical protein
MAMFARNGILAGGDRTTGIVGRDTECPAETGRRLNRQRKCRHKRPIQTFRENTLFERTGWWRKQSCETGLEVNNREFFENSGSEQAFGGARSIGLRKFASDDET